MKIPKEWIELAIKERPDLTRAHITEVMARRFEIHYQGSSLTPEALAKKWVEWIVAEHSNGGNGHERPKPAWVLAKEAKEREKAERKRLSDLDRERFLGKGKGTTNGTLEVTSHERH